MPTFTPGTRLLKNPRSQAPFSRLGVPTGITVLKTGSSYAQVTNPRDEDITAADVVYLGGRTYTITEIEAAALTAAGYVVTE